MQKMVVVNNIDSRELNKYFEEGWRLVSMVVAGTGEGYNCFCYVVIEKDTEQK